jgi:hypothetical protein
MRTLKRDTLWATTHQLRRCASPPSGGLGRAAKAVLQTASFAVLTIDTDPPGHSRLGASPWPGAIQVLRICSGELPERVLSSFFAISRLRT